MSDAQHPARRLYEALQEQRDNAAGGELVIAKDDDLDRVVIDGEFSLEAATVGIYPFPSGDHTVIGPECFTDGTVIAYKGENYVRQERSA